MSEPVPIPIEHKANASGVASGITLPLAVQTNRKWIGLAIPSSVFDRMSWLKSSGIILGDIIDIPSFHLTLLFGFKPDKWDDAVKMVRDATLELSDITFDSTPLYISPTHTTMDFWCLHVNAKASPKLMTLMNQLRDTIPIPDNKDDHIVPPHITICSVVRPTSHSSSETSSSSPSLSSSLSSTGKSIVEESKSTNIVVQGDDDDDNLTPEQKAELDHEAAKWNSIIEEWKSMSEEDKKMWTDKGKTMLIQTPQTTIVVQGDDDEDNLTPEQKAELNRQEAELNSIQATLAVHFSTNPPDVPTDFPRLPESECYGSRHTLSTEQIESIKMWIRIHQTNGWTIHITSTEKDKDDEKVSSSSSSATISSTTTHYWHFILTPPKDLLPEHRSRFPIIRHVFAPMSSHTM